MSVTNESLESLEIHHFDGNTVDVDESVIQKGLEVLQRCESELLYQGESLPFDRAGDLVDQYVLNENFGGIYIAQIGERVACVLASKGILGCQRESEVRLDWLATAQDFRGRGIASSVHGLFEANNQNRNVTAQKVRAKTHFHDSPIEVYRHWGYEVRRMRDRWTSMSKNLPLGPAHD